MYLLRFGRWVAVFALALGLALGVTLLRAGRRQMARKTIALESAWVRSKKAIWEADLVVARLSAPKNLRDSVYRQEGEAESADRSVTLAMARERD